MGFVCENITRTGVKSNSEKLEFGKLRFSEQIWGSEALCLSCEGCWLDGMLKVTKTESGQSGQVKWYHSS